MSAHLITLSGPDMVRMEIHDDGGSSHGVEGPPEQALSNAWCLVDSARKAFEKGGRGVPPAIHDALEALSSWREA